MTTNPMTTTQHDLTFYENLKARGILYQATEHDAMSLADHLKKPVTLYCGFDPSSDSLHVGNLFPLITLRRFQLAGHRPIIILGGATGLIGDPSGKSSERVLLTPEVVQKNLEGIKKVASQFLDFDSGSNGALILNNYDFYKSMNVLEFLRDVGKFFSVNQMVAKDSVKNRMEDREQGISYTEFSYTLLQSYDFYHLYKNYGCTLQIGASDQWGNITSGTELIRRKTAAFLASHEPSAQVNSTAPTPTFGMTHPLITKSDGTKFGKTEKGAIWLTAQKTSSFQFYQAFIQAPDDVVCTWMKYLTFVPLEEIHALEEKTKTEPEKKAAQIRLAQELTRLVHGDEAVQKAEKATRALFGSEIKELDLGTLQDVFADAPHTTYPHSRLSEGLPLIDALVESGLFQSKGAARKEIPAGGVYVNNDRITDATAVLKPEQLIAEHAIVLRKGKRNYHILKFT